MLWVIYGIIAAALAALFIIGDDGNIAGMESEKFAGLVFYGTIFTVLASGFMASRDRFGTMAKQAIIWLSIIVACVAAYEYRYELQNAGSRISAGLIPGVAVTSIDENGDQTVQVAKNGSHFETEGKINGKNMEFVVDTGATTVVLTFRTAEKVGLSPESLTFSVPVSTANGVAKAAPVRLDTIQIGGISRSNVAALVAEQGQLFNNLLGMNFLDTLSGFDVRRDRLILRD